MKLKESCSELSNYSHLFEGQSLLELPDLNLDDTQKTWQCIIVDLDDLNNTKPLNQWSLEAWKSTFSDFLLKITDTTQKISPILIGYTNKPSYESASIAIKIGVRDIFSSEDSSEKLKEYLPFSEHIQTPQNNLYSFEDYRGKDDTSISKQHTSTEISFNSIPFPIQGLEGDSNTTKALKNMIRRCAPLDTSLLLYGEQGSGKKLIAQTIHRHSLRNKKPFISINLSEHNHAKLEKELFGTPDSPQVTVFEKAQGGTLFINEISQANLALQAKLLRVLQEKSIHSHKENKKLKLDFRLICASVKNLDLLVKEESFREDLFYRISIIDLEVLALRNRKKDIPEISTTILRRLSNQHQRPFLQYHENVLEKLLLYHWPGNISELEKSLEHAASLCWSQNSSNIELSHLPSKIQLATMSSNEIPSLKNAVKNFEKEYILRTIQKLGGSKEHAAESLGLSLATLYRKISNQ